MDIWYIIVYNKTYTNMCNNQPSFDNFSLKSLTISVQNVYYWFGFLQSFECFIGCIMLKLGLGRLQRPTMCRWTQEATSFGLIASPASIALRGVILG